MALFNAGYPVSYQPMVYPPVNQQGYSMPSQAAQNGGFVRVQNENEARMYPVAPGNSVTFINENAPYCYTKSVDISQLDRPKFEKYRLVKEETDKQAEINSEKVYALKEDVKKEIERLEKMIAEINADIPTA